MYRFKLISNLIALAALAAGFFFSLWPLGFLGLLCAAATGQYVAAVLIGILLDIAFGAPVGYLHFVHVPFMLVSIAACSLQYVLSAYFRESDTGRL